MEINKYIKLDDKDYHALEHVSSTALRTISLNNPLYYKQKQMAEKDVTKSMIMGTLVHMAILEPEEFTKNVIINPFSDKRTKEYKDWAKSSDIEGKTVISAGELSEIEQMKAMMFSHPVALPLFNRATMREMAIIYKDQSRMTFRDYIVKAKLDLIGDDFIADIKTSADISPHAFINTVVYSQYHLQAAFYRYLDTCVTGKTKDFYFIAIRNQAPYDVAVYKLSNGRLDQGDRLWWKAFTAYRAAAESKIWGGYDEIITID
jgi:exodeoxyribonuclease VIII